MSSTEEIILPKRHKHTRSAATPSSGITPSPHPQSPHHLNAQAREQNNQYEMNYSPQPTTPPRTPRRDNRSAPQNPHPNTNESAAKNKGRNKNRPKNVVTSPAVKRNGRQTPPETMTTGLPSSAKPINTPSTAVYAGATFHASPAPSSLPIPSFFSKSVPESPALKGLKSAPPSKQTDSPPSLPNPVAATQREESPLDFFFKADREEKARARSASSAKPSGAASGPFPPPVSPRNAQTPPAPSTLNRERRGHQSRSSNNGIFAMEMDSPSPGTPYGPAFSTPYTERINAARSGKPLARQNSQEATDRSEALKAYLFSGHISPPPPVTNSTAANVYPSPSTPTSSNGAGRVPAFSPNTQHTAVNISNEIKVSTTGNRASGRSSGLRQEMTPTKTPTRTPDRNMFYDNSPTPSRTYGDFSNSNDLTARLKAQSASSAPPCGISSGKGGADLRGMEESLRKMLNLGSVGSSGAASPVATTSIPTYSGSGVPSMDGINNGVR